MDPVLDPYLNQFKKSGTVPILRRIKVMDQLHSLQYLFMLTKKVLLLTFFVFDRDFLFEPILLYSVTQIALLTPQGHCVRSRIRTLVLGPPCAKPLNQHHNPFKTNSPTLFV